MAGWLVGMDVVAAVEVDVGVDRRRQPCEVDVVEQSARRSLTLDDLVHAIARCREQLFETAGIRDFVLVVTPLSETIGGGERATTNAAANPVSGVAAG